MRTKSLLNLALATLLGLALLGCATATPVSGEARDLHDMPVTVIEGETTWSGRVVVDRIVIVRRGGHLTVAPGTRVLFKRVDWDIDNVGDAEITVEGRLTAVGREDAPILFASAEDNPAPADWKYLHVNFAEGAAFDYVRVSHAFSGLQVHYSPATVKNSEFRHNIDGVRFSTARLSVTGSLIAQNRHGIRFEERGHPANVTGNEVSLNDVGIFAVTDCFGKSTITGNNLRDNRTGVKMGLEQTTDLPLSGNYWGSDAAGARATFFDGASDSELGKILIDPVLEQAAAFTRPFPLPTEPDWARATAKDMEVRGAKW
jgi:nitrous oxidase accessory protein NosD